MKRAPVVSFLPLVAILACNEKPAKDPVADSSGSGTTPTATASVTPMPSSSSGAACGAKTCPAGETCCNASCGICTPPGGACIQMACNGSSGDVPADPPDAGKPSAGQTGQDGPLRHKCKADADCKLFSSYCGDAPCACFGIGKGAAAPACKKNQVSCLVDPCGSKVAKCQSGFCEAASK